MGVEGIAVVTFVIEADGRITGVSPVRGLNEDITREIVRVAESLPSFEPGRMDGVAVRVQFNLPIKFALR